MKTKTKNGTKGAAKSPAKTKGTGQGARASASTTTADETPTPAAAPVAADALFTDCPFFPLELRTRAAWRDILGGGAYFARRIVTEAGEDWRAFEELARAVAAGSIVPPTAAKVAEYWKHWKAAEDRFTAWVDASAAGDEKERARIEASGPLEEWPFPERWKPLERSTWIETVYFWFFELKDKPYSVLAEIVKDAAPGFQDYRRADLERKARAKVEGPGLAAYRERLEEAATQEERNRIADEEAPPDSSWSDYCPGNFADSLFNAAMQYLERRLAILLTDDGGLIETLAPAWDSVRLAEANTAIAAADALAKRKREQARADALARLGKESAPRRSEAEQRALEAGIERMRRRVQAGQSRPAAARDAIREIAIPSGRTASGKLSASSLLREYKERETKQRAATK